MVDFVHAVNERLTALRWTPYKLTKVLDGKLTPPTIYNFFNRQPVKSDSLAVIFDAVGLTTAIDPLFEHILDLQRTVKKATPRELADADRKIAEELRSERRYDRNRSPAGMGNLDAHLGEQEAMRDTRREERKYREPNTANRIGTKPKKSKKRKGSK